MIFDLLWAVKSESVERLPLDQLINEIGCLKAPSLRHLSTPDLDLLAQDVVTYFLAVLAYVRPPAKHALISDDANSKIVDCDSVVLTAHNFGSHVAGCSTGVFGVFGVPDTCYT